MKNRTAKGKTIFIILCVVYALLWLFFAYFLLNGVTGGKTPGVFSGPAYPYTGTVMPIAEGSAIVTQPGTEGIETAEVLVWNDGGCGGALAGYVVSQEAEGYVVCDQDGQEMGLVEWEWIYGKAVGTIPALGGLFLFMGSPSGYIVLACLAIGLILWTVVYITGRKDKEKAPAETFAEEEPEAEEISAPKKKQERRAIRNADLLDEEPLPAAEEPVKEETQLLSETEEAVEEMAEEAREEWVEEELPEAEPAQEAVFVQPDPEAEQAEPEYEEPEEEPEYSPAPAFMESPQPVIIREPSPEPQPEPEPEEEPEPEPEPEAEPPAEMIAYGMAPIRIRFQGDPEYIVSLEMELNEMLSKKGMSTPITRLADTELLVVCDWKRAAFVSAMMHERTAIGRK